MDFAPEGGETMREVFDRIDQTVTKIAARHPGQEIALVSHGCAIRNLMTRIKFGDIAYLKDADWHDNTSVSLLEFDGGAFRIVFEGDTGHLDDETTTLGKQTWWKQPGTQHFE